MTRTIQLVELWCAVVMAECQIGQFTSFLERSLGFSKLARVLDVEPHKPLLSSIGFENTQLVCVDVAYRIGLDVLAVEANVVDGVLILRTIIDVADAYSNTAFIELSIRLLNDYLEDLSSTFFNE